MLCVVEKWGMGIVGTGDGSGCGEGFFVIMAIFLEE